MQVGPDLADNKAGPGMEQIGCGQPFVKTLQKGNKAL
jgi:hypothetical protein